MIDVRAAEESRLLAQSQRRLVAFNRSLPRLYQDFALNKSPNPGLCEYLFKFWRNPDTIPDDGDDPPELFGFGERSGLLLFGAPRSGKTRFACEAVRRKISQPTEEANARFISAVDWGFETSQRAKKCELDGWADETVDFAWDRNCQEPLLIIDDLDKLRCTETVQSSLFGLIETATANEVALLITTNCSASDLVNKFDRSLGPAIVARIQEFCTPVNFSVQMPRMSATNIPSQTI